MLPNLSFLTVVGNSPVGKGLFTPRVSVDFDASIDAWEWIWDPFSSIIANVTAPIERSLPAIVGKQVWIGCERESLNGLLKIDFNWFMIITGPLLVRIQKLAIQHLRFKIYSIHICFLIIASNGKSMISIMSVNTDVDTDARCEHNLNFKLPQWEYKT